MAANTPTVSYARTADGVNIAYQVVGDESSDLDLVMVPGWISHLDVQWEGPELSRFLRRLASFSRLILFDKRGTGLSDRPTSSPTIEERIDDIRAVMDAVGSERAALVGFFDGASTCAVFAATHPDRVQALVLSGGFPAGLRDDELTWNTSPEAFEMFVDAISAGAWGGAEMLPFIAPTAAGDADFVAWWARYERSCASPAAAAALQTVLRQTDIRPVLPLIRVPTLIVHRDHDVTSPLQNGQYLADHIPGATLVVAPGFDATPYTGDMEAVVGPIEEFLTGRRGESDADRVLATVLFTDIVGSTERAVSVGDARWRRQLDDHDSIVRAAVERARGRFIKSTGDGALATFDGPARGIRCATGLVGELQRAAELPIRVGLHTGEIELRGDDVGGLAVHIAARVGALAADREVLVTRTVKDLVAGSGFIFDDRGVHVLKGVPDDWQLYAVGEGQ